MAASDGIVFEDPAIAFIDTLPVELLQNILIFLPTPSLFAAWKVNRRFAAALDGLNWRFMCLSRFRYWDERHAFDARPDRNVLGLDWKRTFLERDRASREASDLLDGIISCQTKRIEKFESFLKIGYDAKDTVLEHLAVDEDSGDGLARRYHSDAILGCLQRAMAIRKWSKLKNGENVSLEEALAAFDMFTLHSDKGDLEETTRSLDTIASDILAEILDFEEKTFRQKALLTATYLRRKNLVGIRAHLGHRYHDLGNNFLSLALRREDHTSLPLISSAVYCCIARRLGIDAWPCALPFHVVVTARSTQAVDPDGRPLQPNEVNDVVYLDPFTNNEEIAVDNLLANLRLAGVPRSQQIALLAPTPLHDLVIRTARNILVSLREETTNTHSTSTVLPALDLDGAFYGALWAFLIIGIPTSEEDPVVAAVRQRNYLPRFLQHFETCYPNDAGLIEAHIVPMFENSVVSEDLRATIGAIRSADSKPKSAKWRTEATQQVRFKIGQVFRHRRFRYLAVITGWDTRCKADERWKYQMGVNQLPRGSEQSFYNALVEDKSTRYVAEDNIVLIRPDVPRGLMPLAGKYFKRWDKDSKCFISNIKDEYPDD